MNKSERSRMYMSLSIEIYDFLEKMEKVQKEAGRKLDLNFESEQLHQQLEIAIEDYIEDHEDLADDYESHY